MLISLLDVGAEWTSENSVTVTGLVKKYNMASLLAK